MKIRQILNNNVALVTKGKSEMIVYFYQLDGMCRGRFPEYKLKEKDSFYWYQKIIASDGEDLRQGV